MILRLATIEERLTYSIY